MTIDTKKMAYEIEIMLLTGARLRWGNDDGILTQDILYYCKERANNLAQAMPELIRECTTQTHKEAEEQALLYAQACVGKTAAVLTNRCASEARDEIRPEDEPDSGHHHSYMTVSWR